MTCPKIAEQLSIVEYTRREIEQKAHDYLRSRPDVQFKIPINVEALLESCGSVGDIDLVPGLARYTNHEGVVCRHRTGNLLQVYLDKDGADFGSKASFYAVQAEELAHILLHQAVFIQVKSISDFFAVQKSMEWPRMERDARWLSAALRMPFQNLILSAQGLYPKVVSEHGYDAWTVQKLLRNALAEKFVVPQMDMQRRLMEWPCLVHDRAAMSLQAKSPELLSEDAVLRVDVPQKQRTMF